MGALARITTGRAPWTHAAEGTAQASRSTAVDRVLKGITVSLCGGGAFLAGSLVPFGAVSYFGLVIGGIGLFGLGAVTASRAASHLWRFGRAGSSRALVATAGLGCSVVAFAVTHLLLVMGIEPVVRGLNGMAMLGAVGFASLLLVLMVRTLACLALGATDPRSR